MSNEMKIILENWRKFSNQTDLKTVLVETKNYNSSLDNLILEHKAKKISTEKYISILEESINNDLKELEKINKQIISEGILDKAKQLGQKVAGAVGGAVNSAIQKVNDIILKVSMMVYEAPRKAIPLLLKTINFIRNFKQTNPKIYAFLVVSLKVIAIAAIAYVVLNPGTAHASVEMPKLGGGSRLIDPNSAEGKELLGALKLLTPENLQGSPLEGIDQEKLSQATQIIQKAVMSKDPQKVEGALNTVLKAAETLRLQAKTSGEGGTLEKLGAKIVQVTTEIAQKSQEAASTSTAGQINNISSLKDLVTPEGAAKAVAKYIQDNPDFKGTGGQMVNPSNVIKSILKLSGEQMRSLDFKNAQMAVARELQKI